METNNQVLTMREQLSAILHKCGFATQETDEHIFFTYEGLDMAIFLTPDTSFLGIYVPNICQVNEGNELQVLRRVNQLNDAMKYVKFFILKSDTVWISYERQLVPDEVIAEALVAFMLDQLIHACMQFNYLEEKEENA